MLSEDKIKTWNKKARKHHDLSGAFPLKVFYRLRRLYSFSFRVKEITEYAFLSLIVAFEFLV